ncbi:MAG TPA: hypothetical protein VLJ88_09675 [Propionibacteriaceae bacterium]|nr:hypothetical protein [Propionibacteriaceae bacterium]
MNLSEKASWLRRMEFDLGPGGVILLKEHEVEVWQLGGSVDDVLDR